MALSKNYGFGEDATMLRDSARRLFADNVSADQLHRLVAHDYDVERAPACNWNKAHWDEICALGWQAACIPEACGGVGLPLVAAVAIAEEAGKAAFPSPLLSSYNASFVLQACDTDAAKKVLEAVIEGVAVTLAITNAQGSWRCEDSDVNANGGVLNGAAYFVQDAQKADKLLVSANTPDGLALYVVDADAEGVDIIADSIIDLTRDQAHITFNNVKAEEVAVPGKGNVALDKAMPAILCINAADMVGAGEWLLQTTSEYVSTRVQFERPLGFFQAVKHPLVNVMLEIDKAKSLSYAAACAYDQDPAQAGNLARMANSSASDMAEFSASRAVQFHGGIGFTWECYVHLFFKRQMHNQALWGDGKYQRRRLADSIVGEVA